MPHIRKRRADVLGDDDDNSNHDDDGAPSDQSPPPTRRRRATSTPSSSGSPAPTQIDSHTQSMSTTTVLANKLVRLALSTGHGRVPLRRADISTKILTEAHSRSFKPVFAEAQNTLRQVFGMQLVELPSREKTSLKDRRTQASQASASVSGAGSKSWILVSLLGKGYKTNAAIVGLGPSPPTAAPEGNPTADAEATYTALSTFIVSLLYLHHALMPEAKLARYLKRVHVDSYTPLDTSTDKLLARMVRDGYLERRRSTDGGDELVEWAVGPRARVEIGPRGVAGLVRAVYGVGAEHPPDGDDPAVKEDHDELNARLVRSLGVANLEDLDEDAELLESAPVGGGGTQTPTDDQPPPQRRARPRRGQPNDPDDDG